MKLKLSVIIFFITLFFGAGVYLVGYMKWYIDIASFVLVVVLPYIVTSVLFPVSDQIAFCKASGKAPSDEDLFQIKRALLCLDTYMRFSIGCAVSAVFMGLIAIMASMDNSSSVGEGISVLLIAPFYTSLSYILIIVPCRSALKRQLLGKHN